MRRSTTCIELGLKTIQPHHGNQINHPSVSKRAPRKHEGSISAVVSFLMQILRADLSWGKRFDRVGVRPRHTAEMTTQQAVKQSISIKLPEYTMRSLSEMVNMCPKNTNETKRKLFVGVTRLTYTRSWQILPKIPANGFLRQNKVSVVRNYKPTLLGVRFELTSL